MSGQALRIAIVSTGRSGTTWLQLLLSHLYDAAPVGARDWDATTGSFATDGGAGLVGRLIQRAAGQDYATWPQFWGSLPSRAIIHAHWHAHPPLVEELADRGVPVVTMARHPLDVLISHLAWVNRNQSEDLGLSFLRGATPTSEAFLDFATGKLAQWLLAITPGWWLREGVARVRYEDLADDPQRELKALAEALGLERRLSVEDALAAAGRESLQQKASGVAGFLPSPVRGRLLALWAGLSRGSRRAFVEQHRERKHYWQGTPGLWREFLPAESARTIAAAHQQSFECLGYDCDPDPNLTPAEAEANWLRRLV
ncbi:MAG: sulfotransferase domain-containing protein [Dehalococcoidia bacterium]